MLNLGGLNPCRDREWFLYACLASAKLLPVRVRIGQYFSETVNFDFFGYWGIRYIDSLMNPSPHRKSSPEALNAKSGFPNPRSSRWVQPYNQHNTKRGNPR